MSRGEICVPNSEIPYVTIKPHRICFFWGLLLAGISVLLCYFSCHEASAESALLSSAFGHEIKMIGGSRAWSYAFTSLLLWSFAACFAILGGVFALHSFYSGIWLRHGVLESRCGWPFRTEHSVPWDKIESVSLSVRFWDIPFGTGTVVVKGTGGAKVTMRMAANAQDCVRRLKEAIKKHHTLIGSKQKLS